jgi:hypothetical protein
MVFLYVPKNSIKHREVIAKSEALDKVKQWVRKSDLQLRINANNAIKLPYFIVK